MVSIFLGALYHFAMTWEKAHTPTRMPVDQIRILPNAQARQISIKLSQCATFVA